MTALLDALTANVSEYAHTSATAARSLGLATLLSPARLARLVLNTVHVLAQLFIIALFKPPPPPHTKSNLKPKHRGRIAIIGAGLTGVSSAAHAMAHGFDVVLYEQTDRVGGIWAHVNASSGLQLNSLLYRFHPGVLWRRAFPRRDEILAEIRHIWKQYGLDGPRTKLNTPVTSVRRATRAEMDRAGVPEDDRDPTHQGHARWVVNEDGASGLFDAVVVTVGTCGAPQWIGFPGMPEKEIEKRRRDGEERVRKGDEEEGGDEGKPTHKKTALRAAATLRIRMPSRGLHFSVVNVLVG